MENKTSRNLDKRAILGIAFVILGILFLADNLGWISFSIWDTIFSLPMLAIVIGIIQVNNRRNTIMGILLIIGGLIFLIPHIFSIPYNTEHLFWPAVLVALGIFILLNSKGGNKQRYKKEFKEWADAHKNSQHNEYKEWKKGYKYEHHHAHHHWFDRSESSSEYLDELNILGGSEKKMTTKSFKGGKITCIFGGSTYDLKDCELAEGKNVIDVANLFGGTKLILPSHWKVHVEIVSVFGGFSDKRVHTNVGDNPDRELHIIGFVFFGGGEIKSY